MSGDTPREKLRAIIVKELKVPEEDSVVVGP